jgi:hypothetical protein
MINVEPVPLPPELAQTDFPPIIGDFGFGRFKGANFIPTVLYRLDLCIMAFCLVVFGLSATGALSGGTQGKVPHSNSVTIPHPDKKDPIQIETRFGSDGK